MSKRRDNKGRILRSGEIQRSYGRYVYQYTDFTGRRRSVYSSRLEKTDSYPEGSLKRELSLREKEKEIKDKLERGICDFDTNITVLKLTERYIAAKTGVKESTKCHETKKPHFAIYEKSYQNYQNNIYSGIFKR